MRLRGKCLCKEQVTAEAHQRNAEIRRGEIRGLSFVATC
jgi:hypothetical protein